MYIKRKVFRCALKYGTWKTAIPMLLLSILALSILSRGSRIETDPPLHPTRLDMPLIQRCVLNADCGVWETRTVLTEKIGQDGDEDRVVEVGFSFRKVKYTLWVYFVKRRVSDMMLKSDTIFIYKIKTDRGKGRGYVMADIFGNVEAGVDPVNSDKDFGEQQPNKENQAAWQAVLNKAVKDTQQYLLSNPEYFR